MSAHLGQDLARLGGSGLLIPHAFCTTFFVEIPPRFFCNPKSSGNLGYENKGTLGDEREERAGGERRERRERGSL